MALVVIQIRYSQDSACEIIDSSWFHLYYPLYSLSKTFVSIKQLKFAKYTNMYAIGFVRRAIVLVHHTLKKISPVVSF